MRDKIKILHVNLYLDMGGLETLIIELCKNINIEQFEIKVLCLMGYDPIYKQALEKWGITVHLIKKERGLNPSFFLKVIKFLRNEDVDIIHSHSGCFFNAAISGYFANVPRIIYTAHGMPIESGFQTWIEDKIAAIINDKLVAVSEEIKRSLIRRFPLQKGKVELIINGVNSRLFCPVKEPGHLEEIKRNHNLPLEKTIIGSVGRLESVKNYSILIRAFKKVLTEHQDTIHLVFIGDGEERKMLEDLSHKLGIKKSISFLGVQYKLHNLIPVIDIFALSSLSEGTSVSLLEAQSCGIPAIVTDVGGNRNIIKDGYNGLLFKVNDHVEMAKKIDGLLKDKKLLCKMRTHARSMVLRKFELFSMVKSYEQLYEKLMTNYTFRVASNELVEESYL